jgi:SAM-dependent methyltransferase
MPLEEDIGKAYLSYYTHYDDVRRPDNLASRIYGHVRSRYVATKYGYRTSDNSRWNRILGSVAYLNPIRRTSFDGSVFWLNANPNGRLLEVGCGSGAMLKSMEGLGWRVEGVDFDPLAVDEAGKKSLLVHVGTLKAQEFSENSFDAIVMSHVIEHVHDPIDLLRGCHRILKPGGFLVVITPNAASWGHRIYGADWRGLEPPRHLHIFTLPSLSLVSTRAGFTANVCRSVVRANGTLLASKMLRRWGKLDKERLTVKLRLWAEVTGLVQWAGLLVDRAAGEEIVMISAK